jgi:chromosome segregation ATPase
MSSISYYENLISECNGRIRKYKEQIEGLEAFKKETINGTEIFSTVTSQRRNHIDTSLADTVKHPMVKKLHGKIHHAIDKEYENSVMDNFYEIKSEADKAIKELREAIEEENRQISAYRSKIAEIREEERREAERRESERRESERRETRRR